MPSLKRSPGSRSIPGAIGIVVFVMSLAVAQVDFQKMRKLAYSRYGPVTAQMVDEWQTEIAAMRGLDDKEKLVRANNFFNSRMAWRQDIYIWDQQDYWATPLEFMGRGMGDCEDFAIAKYVTLILAGVDIDRLRITYVKAQLPNKGAQAEGAHMVLAYYPTPTAEPLILDNMVNEILPASKRTDLTPVYGFNSQGIWVGGASKPASTEPESKLSRWRDLLRRASEEGLG